MEVLGHMKSARYFVPYRKDQKLFHTQEEPIDLTAEPSGVCFKNPGTSIN